MDSETAQRDAEGAARSEPELVLLWEWTSENSGQVLRAWDTPEEDGVIIIGPDMDTVVYELDADSNQGRIKKILTSEQANHWVLINCMEWIAKDVKKTWSFTRSQS